MLEKEVEENEIINKNSKNNNSGISEIYFEILLFLFEISPLSLMFVIPMFEKGIMVNFYLKIIFFFFFIFFFLFLISVTMKITEFVLFN
jgi:hypothetical protein